jgi:hypothetical protein
MISGETREKAISHLESEVRMMSLRRSFRNRVSPWMIVILLIGALSGCATTGGTKGSFESGLLPKKGAAVDLGTVSILEGKSYEVDAAGLLREAITEALRKQGLDQARDGQESRFVLSAQVLDYEMGDAFKRWLLPGYGSTILAVRGELTEAKTGASAGTIEHKRGIYIGGVFTIGAWKTIFQSVADDMAKDLKIRIDGGGFLVRLNPRSAREVAVPQARTPLKVRLVALEDRRPDKGKIGERYAAFGVSMGEVFPGRSVPEYLNQTVSDDLRAAGLTLVDKNPDVTVGGEILAFWVETKTTPLYWDVIGTTEVKITFEPARPGGERLERRLSSRQVKRTYVWPTATLIEGVIDTTIDDLMGQLHSLDVWDRVHL